MLEKLSFQLQQAIEREEFEEAARLRDEIRALKKEVRDA
ncbi:MAG: UvrB/UvrC motif-containing protein [Acetivibrio ethanolgignens]